MTMPRKEQIIEKAIELWRQDRIRANDPSFDLTPERHELQEGDYLTEAQSMLMTDQCQAQVENRDYLPEIPSELDFNVEELLNTGFYISGTTGSGKSDIAMYISERLMQDGIVVFVFDPSQDWQNRSSIPYCVTVYAKKPLDVMLNGHSTIFDVSLLTIPQQKILVEWFCKTIFEHQARIPKQKRKRYFIIFEESHTYFPQGSFRAKGYENAIRLLTQGRNYNVRMGVITQFSSLVDKNAMRYMKQRYFGYTDEKNDVEYLRSFLGSDAIELKKLDCGEFLYYHAGKISRIAINPYQSNIPKTEPKIPMKPKPQQTQKSSASAFLTLSVLLGIAFLIGWMIK